MKKMILLTIIMAFMASGAFAGELTLTGQLAACSFMVQSLLPVLALKPRSHACPTMFTLLPNSLTPVTRCRPITPAAPRPTAPVTIPPVSSGPASVKTASLMAVSQFPAAP